MFVETGYISDGKLVIGHHLLSMDIMRLTLGVLLNERNLMDSKLYDRSNELFRNSTKMTSG
jgi:hypothetical protein